MIYAIYIKSHTEAPDFELELDCNNRKEAIEAFYGALQGEYDRKFISEHMLDS